MLFFDGFLGLLFLALWLFCIIDVITTPEGQSRNLPKIAWLLLVILLMDIGSIAWLLAGRPWNAAERVRVPVGGSGGGAPQARRPVATNPDDDEEFLATLRSRAEEQRRRAREAQPPKDEPERPAEDG